ncbi:unnamed protein product [Prunus armeniaca]|uniref:Uncharacterized protein n=1 Tax=Prunus armeniaca TaxID=36596 RepID=A0A6J5WPD8_PRUAR|nr:unnamed protein product [Prunus armeniaca]
MQLSPMKTNPCLWTLPKENWVGERSRSSVSKTQQTVKSPSTKGACNGLLKKAYELSVLSDAEEHNHCNGTQLRRRSRREDKALAGWLEYLSNF